MDLSGRATQPLPLMVLAFVTLAMPTAVSKSVLISAPVVSNLDSANRAFSAHQSVTANGLNFALVNITPTGYVALRGCDTAAWSSATAVQCLQSSVGTPSDASMVMTVSASLCSTAQFAFTFDGGVWIHIPRKVE